MTNKERFMQLYAKIDRKGTADLLEWLEQSDFFVAPASTKFHSAVAGGLCFHSLQVYKRFKQNLENEYGEELSSKVSNETIAIIALLHDLCKTDCYKVDYRNVKVNNEWTKQPYYSFNDSKTSTLGVLNSTFTSLISTTSCPFSARFITPGLTVDI